MHTQSLPNDGDWESDDTPYSPKKLYARTKREEVVITEVLAERLRGRGVVVHAMHPGWADTEGLKRAMPSFRKAIRPIIRNADEGADTIVWLGAAPEPERTTGLFWHDRRPRPTHYRIGPALGRRRAHARGTVGATARQRSATPGSSRYESAAYRTMPGADLNRRAELVLARDRGRVEPLVQVLAQIGHRGGREPQTDLRGQADGGCLDRPHRLEHARAAVALIARPLPARQARAEARRLAHDRPLAGDRIRRRDRDLDRPGLGSPGAREVGENHRALGRARELAPPTLGVTIKAFALKAAEQERTLGPRQALVLDRVRHPHHRSLGQELPLERGKARSERCVHRGRLLIAGVVGKLDRRLKRQPALAGADHRAHPGDVGLRVAPVPARHPARLRESVTDLPHPQRRLVDAAAGGHLAHRQPGL